MECYDPKLKVQLGKKTLWRHWSLSNAIHKAIGVPFNCNKCIHCRKKNSTELARRCVLHASLYLHNSFITLTYDTPHVGDNSLDYTHIQKFKKRLRKSVAPKKIEIFNVHEYGKNGRKHWHLVIFNHDFLDKTQLENGYYTSKELQELWPLGFVSCGTVTEASAMYQAQYTQKDIANGNINNEKKTKSNHSGIGKPYFNLHYKQMLQLGYIPLSDNVKMPLPRYFEKLAHKHWSHFYDQSQFFDTHERKAIHRPFKQGEENKEIADLYIIYKQTKQQFTDELIEKWKETLDTYTRTKRSPDFVKSGENTIHNNRQKQFTKKEKF